MCTSSTEHVDGESRAQQVIGAKKQASDQAQKQVAVSGKEKLIYAGMQTSLGAGDWLTKRTNGVNQALTVDSECQTTEGQRDALPGRRKPSAANKEAGPL